MNKKYLYLFLLICLITILFFGLDNDILYAKTGIKRWIPFIIIFFVIPFLMFNFLNKYKVKGKTKFALSLIPIIIVGPLFGLWSGYLSNKQLNEDGKFTIGIVSEKFKSGRKSGSPGVWLVKCKFEVDNEMYITFSKKDKANLYRIGDTLNIKYSKKNPQNHIIVELE
ncbi:hypothetical protein [Aquimarina sp. AD10]|uniref:hypothetical protein n=1 Tax=Aquimarina sp. AD10 TaxID=1714849 RepID=UPI0011C46AB1|nr:hypothetical protein [Aquimarina sp. AD10]